ncbi:MAG: N-acetyl-alpha-D-glucosaminyl L-malate synthase BshA [bacterium]
MRIGIVCYPTYGGSGVVATELGMALAKRKHEIHIIAYDLPFRIQGEHPNLTFHKVDVIPYPLFKFPPYTIALVSRIWEVVEEHNLDIVHVHYAVPHSTAAIFAKKILDGGVKIITTLHGTDVMLVGLEPSYYKITEYSINESDGVTAVSNYLRQMTYEKFNIIKDIEVIYNFVDVERYCRRDKGENDEKTVVHVSNFRAVKRIQDVILGFGKMLKDADARLVLVGDGPQRPCAEELAEIFRISDRVTFLGNRVDVGDILGRADLFILPSLTESFGLAACEAMSCEVPVVGYRVGGLPEVVVHGETGYLAELGDVDSLAEYGVKILNDDDLRRRMGSRGRARVLEMFNAEMIVEQYERFYESVADEARYKIAQLGLVKRPEM